MNIEEFCAFGYLQEVNRQFFHPLGMALSVNAQTGGMEVRDERDDLQGIWFADGLLDKEKADRVKAKWEFRVAIRLASLGYVVQPIPQQSDATVNAHPEDLE